MTLVSPELKNSWFRYKVLSVVANVAVMAELQNIFKKTMEKFNKIDVLVNNVGYAVTKAYENVRMHYRVALVYFNSIVICYVTLDHRGRL